RPWRPGTSATTTIGPTAPPVIRCGRGLPRAFRSLKVFGVRGVCVGYGGRVRPGGRHAAPTIHGGSRPSGPKEECSRPCKVRVHAAAVPGTRQRGRPPDDRCWRHPPAVRNPPLEGYGWPPGRERSGRPALASRTSRPYPVRTPLAVLSVATAVVAGPGGPGACRPGTPDGTALAAAGRGPRGPRSHRSRPAGTAA